MLERCSLIASAVVRKTVTESGDGVYNYARQFCHYASLALEFLDAWAGVMVSVSSVAGEYVFLLHFRDCGRTKYAWEALQLQFQTVTLQPVVSHQLTWSRFINKRGGPGNNIPCDLHNEHLNKLFKEIIANMGSNFTEQSIQRSARSVSALHDLAETFDRESHTPVPTTAHSTKSDDDVR